MRFLYCLFSANKQFPNNAAVLCCHVTIHSLSQYLPEYICMCPSFCCFSMHILSNVNISYMKTKKLSQIYICYCFANLLLPAVSADIFVISHFCCLRYVCQTICWCSHVYVCVCVYLRGFWLLCCFGVTVRMSNFLRYRL